MIIISRPTRDRNSTDNTVRAIGNQTKGGLTCRKANQTPASINPADRGKMAMEVISITLAGASEPSRSTSKARTIQEEEIATITAIETMVEAWTTEEAEETTVATIGEEVATSEMVTAEEEWAEVTWAVGSTATTRTMMAVAGTT